MKPSLPENPDHFIRQVSANDLKMERSPKLIVKSTADLATTLKGNSHDVSVLKIIVHMDNSNLNGRG